MSTTEYEFHAFADAFPLLEGKNFDEFVEDIRKNGLREKIDLYQGKIIDGRNRYLALKRLGIDPSTEPSKYFRKALYTHAVGGEVAAHEQTNDERVRAYVISKNIRRRDLTAEQKRDALEALIKISPQKSDRQIAKETGVSNTHVGKVRKELEKSGDVSTVDTRTDTKGRKQPSSKPKRTPALTTFNEFCGNSMIFEAEPDEPAAQPEIRGGGIITTASNAVIRGPQNQMPVVGVVPIKPSKRVQNAMAELVAVTGGDREIARLRKRNEELEKALEESEAQNKSIEELRADMEVQRQWMPPEADVADELITLRRLTGAQESEIGDLKREIMELKRKLQLGESFVCSFCAVPKPKDQQIVCLCRECVEQRVNVTKRAPGAAPEHCDEIRDDIMDDEFGPPAAPAKRKAGLPNGSHGKPEEGLLMT